MVIFRNNKAAKGGFSFSLLLLPPCVKPPTPTITPKAKEYYVTFDTSGIENLLYMIGDF